jgi:nucleoside-diphosphate-sugar epimerase
VGSHAIPDYGSVPYRPDHVIHLDADISKLLAATTWSPRVGIAEGMRATVEFERQRLSHLTDTVGST